MYRDASPVECSRPLTINRRPHDATTEPRALQTPARLDSPERLCESTARVSAQPPSPPDTPFTSAVDFRSLPWTTPLARDYCHAFDRLEPFYAGDPAAPDSWLDAIEARLIEPPPAAR